MILESLSHHQPHSILDLKAKLGEGPLWVAQEEALYFVDIWGHKLHRYHPKTGLHKSWEAPAPIGFILPVTDGTFLAGLADGLHRFNAKTGIFAHAALIEPDHPQNRLNDGCVDQEGRIWFGTMDDEESQNTGSLYRVLHQGNDLEVTHWDSGYMVSNGPCLSPCGKVLYACDSPHQIIYAFDVSAEGDLSNKRIFAKFSKGYPDGIVTDSEGTLWCGTWAGGCVTRFSAEGKELEPIKMPVSNVTKVAFGGEDLKTVFVTTARKGLSEEQLEKEPQAGNLFAFRSSVKGQKQHEFKLV